MNNAGANNSVGAAATSIISKLITVAIIILAIFAVYYLYQYLFRSVTVSSVTLLGGRREANPTAPIVVNAKDMVPLYEGGEFTISMWIYITNWSTRQNMNKHILSIGGSNYDTIRVYLDGVKNTLRVKMHMKEAGSPTNSNTDLARSNYTSTFSTQVVSSEQTDGQPGSCDVGDIDLQRWVSVIIAVNGKTCDTYIDGKLARSCVMPTFYKVDGNAYTAKLLDLGGFGGYISNVEMASSALNPDAVYKKYMAGPEPISDIMAWLKSIFEPAKRN